MKLHFIAADKKVGAMAKTIGLADGSNRSYPMAFRMTTMLEEFDVETEGLSKYVDLLSAHAGQGHALYKGMFQRELVNESRRGLTDKTLKTQFMVLDIDGLKIDGLKAIDKGKATTASVKKVAEKVISFMPPALQKVSYVALASSSFGLYDEECSVHIHFLLKEAVDPRALKHYLTSLNFTQNEIYEKLKLTPSKMKIKSVVDPCLAEPARVIYIAPPMFGPTGKNPFSNDKQRFVVVNKSKPLLDLDKELERIDDITDFVNERKSDMLKDKQKRAGLTAFKPKFKRINVDGREVSVVANPPPARFSLAYEDSEFVRYNIGNSKSNAYWVTLTNPEVMYCFSPDEVPTLFKAWDGEAYAAHIERFGGGYTPTVNAETGVTAHVSRTMFIDQESDNYFTVELDIKTDDIVEIKKRKNPVVAGEWMKHYGQMVPDPVPAVHIVNHPDEERTVFSIGDKQFLNRFKPSMYMKDKTGHIFPLESSYGNAWLLHLDAPVISEIILNMLGDDLDCFEHFINWLAFIFQFKNKAETAWMLHGTEGTGKGLFFKMVLRQLFGQGYTAQNTLQGIADDQFNAWMEDVFILMVDEFNIKGTNSAAKTEGMLRNMITEPTMMLRDMQAVQRPVTQRVNFIFATNELDAMPASDKRRITVAPRQMRTLEARLEYLKKYRDETNELISSELTSFARYLFSFKVNKGQASTVLENSARKDAQEASRSASDKFFVNLMEGNFEAFAGILDKPSANLDPNEQYKISRSKTFITANLQYVNTGKACYLHKDDLRALYSYLAGKDISDNAFGRMMGTHEAKLKRVTTPVGHTAKLTTRPYCVEVEWVYRDTDALAELTKNNLLPRGNVSSINQNTESDDERKAKEMADALRTLQD
jgi:hypothetical protein